MRFFCVDTLNFFLVLRINASTTAVDPRAVDALFTNHYPAGGSMKHFVVVIVFASSFISSLAASAQSASPASPDYLNHLLSDAILFDTSSVEKVQKEIVSATESPEMWKQWHTVNNHHFGKDRGSLPMITDLGALHPFFRDKVMLLIEKCKAAGIELAVVESYRTRSKQAEYYAMGSKYTSKRGGMSRHQYGLAVDVVPMVDSVAVWNNPRLWRKIGGIGERLGLTWGGRWRVLYDPGHFEWSGGVSRHQLAKGLPPRIPASRSDEYVSLETQLEKLHTYWQAWEVEQSMMATTDAVTGDGEMIGAGN